MPWYFYLALKQLFPSGRRMPFFTVMSILGVGLGVMLLVVSTGVMGGFGHEIERMIVETQGEVQVRGNRPIGNARELLKAIQGVKGVKAVTPLAEGVGMVDFQGRPTFPAFLGVDLKRVEGVMPLRKYVRWGSVDDLDDDGIILSTALAVGLGARVGDSVQVASPLLLEKLREDEVFLPRELRVVGIFEVGHQHLDTSMAVVTLRRMQDLYGLKEAVHGFNVKIEKGEDADEMAMRINRVLPEGVGARSWLSSNQQFLFVVELEKNLIFFLLLFIIVVAAFSLTSSLLTTVVRKTREVGLLSALGAKPREVAAGFFLQGFIIGVLGTLLGLALGFLAMAYRVEIMGVFLRVTASEGAITRFYGTNSLPMFLSALDFWKIVLFSVAISALAGVLPAWRAARLKPVEALRSE